MIHQGIGLSVESSALDLAARSRRLIGHLPSCFMCKMFTMGWKMEHDAKQVLVWF
jgi:hypothetical protein